VRVPLGTKQREDSGALTGPAGYRTGARRAGSNRGPATFNTSKTGAGSIAQSEGTQAGIQHEDDRHTSPQAALREQLGRWLLEGRNARLRVEREAIEGRVKSMLPPAEPLNP